MRWKGERESENVEDQRGVPARRVMIGGGLGTIAFIVIALLLGADPKQLLQQLANNPPPGAQPQAQGQGPAAGPRQLDPAEEERKKFVSVVLAETEDVWDELFQEQGRNYAHPKLLLFTNEVGSACGMADSAVGPFYCPGDSKVYLDLGFFKELQQKFKAPGEFAQAYVVAHEVGHHVQNLLGTSSKIDAQRRRLSKEEANALSVRLELQADFYAGVWAHHAQKMKNVLEQGDVESALRAATAIGDDTLQKKARGYVVPDTFTHGTSEQRVRWFRRGFETGDISKGDTFVARRAESAGSVRALVDAPRVARLNTAPLVCTSIRGDSLKVSEAPGWPHMLSGPFARAFAAYQPRSTIWDPRPPFIGVTHMPSFRGTLTDDLGQTIGNVEGSMTGRD